MMSENFAIVCCVMSRDVVSYLLAIIGTKYWPPAQDPPMYHWALLVIAEG